MSEEPYITLRCLAGRCEYCPTNHSTKCEHFCHWTLFGDQEDE